MIVFESLKLSSFRNFEDEQITFCPGTNIILGQNGHGKSNLLEALYLICTGKSFRTSHIKELIAFEKEGFCLEAFLKKNGIDHHIIIEYYTHKKKLTIDKNSYPHFHPLLGFLPVVIMTPEMKKLIDGGPSDRRKFFDFFGSQLSRPYFESITRYHKALKQKNAALKLKQDTQVWELLLAKEWLEIEKHRVQFIEKIQNLSQGHLDAYPDLNAKLSLTYVPSLKQSPQTIQDVLRIYQKNKAQEIHTCTTLFGPHRDEIDIGLNGSKASQTASEGQKKMLIAAFSFACFDLLKQTLGTEPLFLIDDYDAHFDLVRKNWISSELKAMSQSFLTSPLTELGAHYEALFIHSGKVNKGVYTYN